MAINRTPKGLKTRLPAGRQGFALLVAVIFMSVMLTFGLSLGALSYKQQTLVSSAIASQYAFYAADAALECMLYADNQNKAFDFAIHSVTPPDVAQITCDGLSATQSSYAPGGTLFSVKERFSLDEGTHCADVTLYKYKDPQGPYSRTTYILSQGYDVACAAIGGPRFASRGIEAHY